MTRINMILCLAGCFSFLAFADIISPESVPFTGFKLPPQTAITIPYVFGHHAVIFCFDESVSLGSISWPLGNATLSARMPRFLKIDSKFTGDFANPSGLITIANGTHVELIVSCNFFGSRNEIIKY